MNRKLTSITGLWMLALFFVAFVIVSTRLTGFRLDLTENNLFTLSGGTENIVKGIDEPIKLYYFYSDKATQHIPALRNYESRVSELLATFVKQSQGKLFLERIDPEPFSEAEDFAAEFGLQAIPLDEQGTNIYFGIAGNNAVGDTEVIPFFQPDKETFLEYELSKLVYNLSHPQKKVLGVLSTIPLEGQSPLFVMEQLKALFEIKEISTAAKEIDPTVNVLMVVHPRRLSEETLQAIDQYVLKGGKLITFVDPLAQNAQQMMGHMVLEPTNEKSSSLDKLFKAWGVQLIAEQVVADKINALTVRASYDSKPDRHPTMLSVRNEYLNRDDLITSAMSNVHVQSAGALEKLEGATTEFTALMTSGPESMLVSATKVDTANEPTALLEDFQPSGRVYTLAARIHGFVATAFPEAELPITQSVEPINVIVVADTDLLADHLWVRLQDFFGYRIPTLMANNGDFVINAVDNLSGSNDLISIRSRGTSARPFEKVLTLQATAEEAFRTKEQALQAKLKETEQKLAELQKNREGSVSLVLSEEQKQALGLFRAEKVKIRKELRDVQHALNKDIEKLETVLKLVNMGVMPIGVFLLAFLMRFIRMRKIRNYHYE